MHDRTVVSSVAYQPRVPIDGDRVAKFCRKWRLNELALFGSVIRDDFHANSDVDVLITIDADAPWNLWHLDEMREELSDMFGRNVDVVSKRALKNPFRRHEILSSRLVLYAG